MLVLHWCRRHLSHFIFPFSCCIHCLLWLFHFASISYGIQRGWSFMTQCFLEIIEILSPIKLFRHFWKYVQLIIFVYPIDWINKHGNRLSLHRSSQSCMPFLRLDLFQVTTNHVWIGRRFNTTGYVLVILLSTHKHTSLFGGKFQTIYSKFRWIFTHQIYSLWYYVSVNFGRFLLLRHRRRKMKGRNRYRGIGSL